MLRVLLLSLMLSFSMHSSAEKMIITFLQGSNGSGYVYEIDTSIIPLLPKWNVNNNNPPLSIKSALDVSRKEIKNMQLKQKMKLSGISLSSASRVGKYIVWYYSVTFTNDSYNRRDGFIEKTIYILMDGSVIKSKKMTKEEYMKWFR